MLEGGASGPTVGVFGEMDSLIVPQHPHADPETGAAHVCGHHCHVGMLLGVAMGLKAPGVMKSLAGRVALLVVPAEEYIEIEHRNGLRRQGQLEFLTGKSEWIKLAALDDVDMAMMTHTTTGREGARFALATTTNGMLAKLVRFEGVASHAGGSPHAGVNALNAAMVGLSAIHAQRETYRDEDTVRVHPIITRGGAAVSSVPADVRMETFVRAKTMDAVVSASQKVDRALRAGAMAVGGGVSITTLPGYLPMENSADLGEVYAANAEALVGREAVTEVGHRSGSTDVGDVSQIMPAIQPYVAAATGRFHGEDYLVQDYGLAVVTAAKVMAMTVVDLLADGARRALEIKKRFRPRMTKREYLAYIRGMASEESFRE